MTGVPPSSAEAARDRFFWMRPGLEVRRGRLLIAGRDAEALAREHGKPLYAFDRQRIAEMVRDLQGDMGDHQIFFLRPVRGYADYRTPVEGLYLSGAGTHPGGGVSGANGRNCAREVLRDVHRQDLRAAARRRAGQLPTRTTGHKGTATA
jgi:hypothetical protein